MKRSILCAGLLLLFTAILLVSCQDQPKQQLVAYRSDFQVWTMRPDGTQVTKAVDLDFATANLKWSPDRTRIAFTVIKSPNQSSIWIANSDGSAPRQVSEEFDSISAAWLNDNVLLTGVITDSDSPDVLPVYDDYTNYILDLQNGTMREYSRGPESVVSVPPGSRWLAWNGHLGLVLHDLDSNAWPISPELLPTGPHAFDVSPSGDTFMVCQHSMSDDTLSGLYIATLEQDGIGEPTFAYPIEDSMCVYVRWSPDGQYVAFLDNRNILYLVDAASFSLIRSFEIGPLVESSFIWSPDSKYVVVHRHYGEPGPGPKEIARVDVETGEIVRLTKNESVEYLTDWVALPSR